MKEFEKYLTERGDMTNIHVLFTGVDTSIVTAIANKKIDAVKLAQKELYQRGLDKNGKWIGPAKAKEYWKIK